MSGKDLGTYYLKVFLKDSRGFINEVSTGARYTNGRYETSPLWATRIEPVYHSEEHLIESEVFMYTEGNFSCDCNLLSFLEDAEQLPRSEDTPCGDSNPVVRLVLIRPDGSELEVYNEQQT